jgi:hypothetical protein
MLGGEALELGIAIPQQRYVYIGVPALATWFDYRTFSGLAAVLLWPWIDYFPSSLLLLGIFLDALIIYFVLAVVAGAVRR